MSTFAVTVETITVLPHPNADALELAEVGRYRSIIVKGAYRSGDLVVYIPEAAIVPEPIIVELGLQGRLAGGNKNRVKAIRLRGELSQGLIYRPEHWTETDLASRLGEDLSEEFGIHKWQPPIPISMSGKAEPAADVVPYTDIENIKRVGDLFEDGERVIATEKLHGTCTIFRIDTDSAVTVTSKGLANRRNGLLEDDTNLYWQTAAKYRLADVGAAILEETGSDAVSIFGETYGKSVQDLTYGTQNPVYACFDLCLEHNGEKQWVDHDRFRRLLRDTAPQLPTVPVLYDGPYDYDRLVELATGQETVSGDGAHLREGIVVRSAIERTSPRHARAIVKFISDNYLTRGSGTEYE